MNGEPAKNERRFVRWAVVLSVLLAALVVAAGWQYNEYRPQLTAGFAQDAAREGRFDLMQQRLDELAVPETMDVYYDAALACAAAAYSCGEYDIALEVLASVPEADTEAYAAFAKKVQSQSAVYTYRKAEKLFEDGDRFKLVYTIG